MLLVVFFVTETAGEVEEEIKRRSISSLVQLPSLEIPEEFSLNGRLYGSDPINIGLTVGIPVGERTNIEVGESVRFKEQKLIRTNSRSLLIKHLKHPRFLVFGMYDPEFQPLVGAKWTVLPNNDEFYIGSVLNIGGEDKPRGLSALDYNSTKSLLGVIGIHKKFQNSEITLESNLKEFTAKLSFKDFDLIYESERNNTELIVKGFEFGTGDRRR
jgi:hypothetical protein